VDDSIRLLRAFAFAAEKHRNHRRKDVNASPYINHLISAARILAEEGQVTDMDLIVAAILHDTIEDTETTYAELEAQFGTLVAEIVREVTDDTTLRKAARKQLQEQRAPNASSRAKQLMIADKISNILDIIHHPPSGWSLERRQEYIVWAGRVVAGCRDVNWRLDHAYDQTVSHALRHLETPAGRNSDLFGKKPL
jgi:guanosine-3',5'-bis(diphosphate) 3'-pyrophosphohydrolase